VLGNHDAPGGIVIPAAAGRWVLIAGFDQLEAQVLGGRGYNDDQDYHPNMQI
jgi:hypothetical protein